MISLGFGLIAALAWGVHDFYVRQVGQATGVYAALIAVLALGCVIAVPISGLTWIANIPTLNIGYGIASGGAYGVGALALYKAFAIGPIRLVAPIIGAYPILSVGWAMVQGQAITPLQSIAVLVIVAGVGFVAASTDTATNRTHKRAAILWSIAAAIGFAVTFALGHIAAGDAYALPLMGVTRVAALITVLGLALLTKAPQIWPKTSPYRIFAVMGVLDCAALSLVSLAAPWPNPEFASVAASTFGLITVVLAALFLRERLSPLQWAAVGMVFGAIAVLGL